MNYLSVIAGKLKGLHLNSPAQKGTHPMGSREKNALFNMLDVTGQKVLDAYAGSGALGIEALSRGAREVVFIEKHHVAARTIQTNLSLLKPEDSQAAKLFRQSVASFVESDSSQDFDIIIADPPYDQIDLAEVATLTDLLKDGGLLALSSPASNDAPVLPGMVVVSSHTYAGARVTMYNKNIK